MDHPDRLETYKGHAIRICVLPPVEHRFRAMYEIQTVGDHEASLTTGVISGDFRTAKDAEEEALQVAKRAIDRQVEYKVEVFSAGCPCCTEVIALAKKFASSTCEVEVLDMHNMTVLERARALGVQSVPAVAINDRLMDCCAGGGVNEENLLAAGLVRP